jgi:hypothetical protein
MSGKQMEGDNPRRRARATRARQDGRTPSARGGTLGSSKQREYETGKRRSGPAPAGGHKPVPDDPAEGRPAEPVRSWPRTQADQPTGEAGVQYRELVAAASARVGLPFDQGRRAAEATISRRPRPLAGAPSDRAARRPPDRAGLAGRPG